MLHESTVCMQKGYIRIDGKTDARQREDLRSKFQTDESVKVRQMQPCVSVFPLSNRCEGATD